MPPSTSSTSDTPIDHDILRESTHSSPASPPATTTPVPRSSFKDSLRRFHYEASATPPVASRALRSSSARATRRATASASVTSEPATPEPPVGSARNSPRKRPTPSSLKSAALRSPSRTSTSDPPAATEAAAVGRPKKKRKRDSSKYAPPSKYAHLAPLTDILAPNLIAVFVGTNPGIRTATAGHAYAHPSNLFWKLLHASGCTDRRCAPEDDVRLPGLYALGNTNLVERPTRDAAELGRAEMSAGTPVLEDKLRRWRPEAVCIVGKGIWEAVWRWRHGGRNPSKQEFRWGWQDEGENMGVVPGEWGGARVFVATSTSGLSASLRPAEKEAIWRPFGQWVRQRRTERAAAELVAVAQGGDGDGDGDGDDDEQAATSPDTVKHE